MNDRMRADMVLLLDTVTELLDEIEDHVDIEDTADGRPRPNWAMCLMQSHGDECRSAVKTCRETDYEGGGEGGKSEEAGPR